jgi:hypothetical protein
MPERKSGLQAIFGGLLTIPQESEVQMRQLFVSDGKLYSGNEADKLLIEKLEKLEKQVSKLGELLSPENKETEEIMKSLKAIKGKG